MMTGFGLTDEEKRDYEKGGAILKQVLQKWPGVAGCPTFAVNLCVCYNVYNCDDIVY